MFSLGTETDAVETVRQGLAHAKEIGADIVLIDTAGRLHIDEALMEELAKIKEIAKPDDILLTVDPRRDDRSGYYQRCAGVP